VPRNEIVGIDLSAPMEDIFELIRTAEYTMLPVYEGNINNVVGILHLRNIARALHGADYQLTKEAITEHLNTPYFIPESTPLSKLSSS